MSNASDLVTMSQRLFSKKANLDSLWQEIAMQVYPERATFTLDRIDGSEFGTHLMESTPAQMRRDFASAIGAILRPKSQQWFRPRLKEKKKNTDRAKAWLDWAGDQQRDVLYGEAADFTAQMTLADNDFATFGNAVTSRAETIERDGVYFQTHHLRDCAWAVDYRGRVTTLHRKIRQYTLQRKVERFGRKSLSDSEKTIFDGGNPWAETEILHIVMPTGLYDPADKKYAKGKEFCSIYVDPNQKTILEEGGYFEMPYDVRRWAITNETAYGHSPAAMLSLCDARLLQSQAQVILEAAEKQVDPPMIAKSEAFGNGVDIRSGAVNWADVEMDGKVSDMLAPLVTGANIKLGLEMKVDVREVINAAWFLNRLTLPSEGDMTATEVHERIAEYIRSAGPIFEPFELDNQRMLDGLFSMCLRLGLFGGPGEIPDEVVGQDIEFEFETPIRFAYQRQKLNKAKEAAMTTGELGKIRPEVMDNIDWDKLHRSAVEAIGGDNEWLLPMEQVLQKRQADQQAMAQAKAGEQLKGIADAAPKITKAMGELPNARQGLEGGLGDLIGAGAQGGDDAAGGMPMPA